MRGDDERRSTTGRRLVPGAADRAREILRANRVVDPDRVVARKPLEPSREERLVREMTAILLPDEDNERRSVDSRGRERADRVAEPGSRVQDRERRLGLPIAQPVAIPTTEASWSASTNSRSAGRPARNGTSVDPGLPKRIVSLRSRRTSTTASRTVVAGHVPTLT